jgi:molybdopterin/thiamine biosynthesis adenylyltransferase
VIGLAGQVLTIVPRETPCLRCLFPEVPEDDEVASCSQAGILGPLAAIVGTLEAREALAFLAGSEARTAGRLLTLDAHDLHMREIPLRRSPTCPTCGPLATVGRIDVGARDDAGFKETR